MTPLKKLYKYFLKLIRKIGSVKEFQRYLKRFIDVVFSFLGLFVALPIIGFVAVIHRSNSNGSVFFSQQRIGLNEKPFNLLKLRSMREIKGIDTTITTANDPRITRVGKIIRRTKIDELPQLWNVLKGEMSFVGPRPDVPELIDTISTKTKKTLLSVRPGITGIASLKYRREEEILARAANPEWFSNVIIFPDKVRLNLKYIEDQSILLDIEIILKTIFGLGVQASVESIEDEFNGCLQYQGPAVSGKALKSA